MTGVPAPNSERGRGVNSNDMTREQAAAVGQSVVRLLAYLGKLRRHMELAGFPADDPPLQLATAAFHAVHDLRVDLHYRACGVDRGPSPRAHDTPPILD
jgi:hypothetical protein